MIGENLQLVTDEPVEAGKLPIILEEFIEYTPFNKANPEDVNL